MAGTIAILLLKAVVDQINNGSIPLVGWSTGRIPIFPNPLTNREEDAESITRANPDGSKKELGQQREEIERAQQKAREKIERIKKSKQRGHQEDLEEAERTLEEIRQERQQPPQPPQPPQSPQPPRTP